MTPRQREVLEFIKEFIGRAGYPPSLREICARFGIKGAKNAAKHLDALERKGFIRRGSHISRGIELVSSTLRSAVSVPIAGRVRAGVPHLAVEDVVGHVALDEELFNCRGAFALRVEGESMTGAGIDPGDLVVVRPQKDALNGEVVVAMLDGEATVKRFYRKGAEIVLKAENPAMGPIRVDGASALEIVGRVVSVIKRF